MAAQSRGKKTALSIARQPDLGQLNEKGELGLSDARKNVKSKDLTLPLCPSDLTVACQYLSQRIRPDVSLVLQGHGFGSRAGALCR